MHVLFCTSHKIVNTSLNTNWNSKYFSAKPSEMLTLFPVSYFEILSNSCEVLIRLLWLILELLNWQEQKISVPTPTCPPNHTCTRLQSALTWVRCSNETICFSSSACIFCSLVRWFSFSFACRSKATRCSLLVNSRLAMFMRMVNICLVMSEISLFCWLNSVLACSRSCCPREER